MKETVLVTSTLVVATLMALPCARASTLLYAPPSKSSAQPESVSDVLESGRYQIKSNKGQRSMASEEDAKPLSQEKPIETPTRASEDKPPRSNRNSSHGQATIPAPPSDANSSKALKPVDQATTMQAAPLEKSDPIQKTTAGEENFQSRFQDVVLGGEPAKLSEYRSYLLPDDIRRNIVEILFAPSYIYNDSNSNFWYRNYFSANPAGNLGATIWITPFFGLSTQYQVTFGQSISNSPTSYSTTPSTDNRFQIGIRFRRFLEGGDRPASFAWGVDYTSYEKKLPSDEKMRPNLNTRGARLVLDTRIPVGLRYSWTFGLEIAPYLSHRETATGLSLSSGTKSESYGFGGYIGGEIQVVRTNRVFWRARYYNEKNIFTGPANQSDPVTGQALSGVTVSNSFSSFELGYIWGY